MDMLGIEKSGPKPTHDPAYQYYEKAVIRAIGEYNGNTNKPIPADDLAAAVGLDKRTVRKIITHLTDDRYHNLPIYALPGKGGGYSINTSIDGAARAAEAHLKRAMTSMRKARQMGLGAKKMGSTMVQMSLDLPKSEQVNYLQNVVDQVAAASPKTAQASVMSTLRRYADDPGKFIDEITEIKRAFRGLLVSEEDLRAAAAGLADAMADNLISSLRAAGA